MQRFYGISPGETRQFKGLKVVLDAHGEYVWMGCKRLELGPQHAVAVIASGEAISFQTAQGKRLLLGEFPAWIARGTEPKNKSIAAMFNLTQFDGGVITITKT